MLPGCGGMGQLLTGRVLSKQIKVKWRIQKVHPQV